ncbi:hypothetical protein PtB15_5B403 [Puccinia triticina]|nr:hypothetical protein PtB15_5B403 [Puccinia triticina]
MGFSSAPNTGVPDSRVQINLTSPSQYSPSHLEFGFQELSSRSDSEGLGSAGGPDSRAGVCPVGPQINSTSRSENGATEYSKFRGFWEGHELCSVPLSVGCTRALSLSRAALQQPGGGHSPSLTAHRPTVMIERKASVLGHSTTAHQENPLVVWECMGPVLKRMSFRHGHDRTPVSLDTAGQPARSALHTQLMEHSTLL